MAGGSNGVTYSCVYMHDRKNCIAEVGSNNIPKFYDPPSSYVWLGLATYCYEGSAPDLPPPFAPLHATEEERNCRATWEKFHEPPHFSKRMVFLNAGKILPPGGKRGVEGMPPGLPYVQVYTQALFQVTGTTNVGGLVFPTRFQWNLFSVTGGRGPPLYPGGMRSRDWGEVEMTRIEVGRLATNYLPPLTPAAVITDTRLANNTNVGRFSYSTYDRRWRTVAELPKFKKTLEAASHRPKRPAPWLFGSVTAVAAVPALLFWLAGRWRQRRGKAMQDEADTPTSPALLSKEAMAGEAGDVTKSESEPASAAQLETTQDGSNAPTHALRVIIWVLGYKLVFFAAVFVAISLYPSSHYAGFRGHLHWPIGADDPTLASRLATWDGAHYLNLAKFGYVKGSPSCAFYPLWPALVSGISWLTGANMVVNGLLLANLFSLAACVLYYGLVQRLHGSKVANWALLLLLSFPGAIFFQFIYTESLFLLLVVLFFSFLMRGNYRGAAMVAFFLPLTKAIGIFCLAPFAWELWNKRRPPREFLWLGLLLAGYLCYFAVLWSFTGNPLEGYQAQRFYPNKPSIANIFNVSGILKSFLNVRSLHDLISSVLDRLFFVLFAVSLPLIWRLNKTCFWYAVFVGAVPALSAWFFSYSRNIMMCFPMFIVLGMACQPARRRWLVSYYLLLLAALQVFFLVQYVSFRWAG